MERRGRKGFIKQSAALKWPKEAGDEGVGLRAGAEDMGEVVRRYSSYLLYVTSCLQTQGLKIAISRGSAV